MSHVGLDDHITKEMLEATLNMLNQFGFFTQCYWHVSDIHLLCEQRRWPQLSHNEAREVFNIFAELYEGDQGLTWAKLEQATLVFLVKHGKINMPTERQLSVDRIKDRELEVE